MDETNGNRISLQSTKNLPRMSSGASKVFLRRREVVEVLVDLGISSLIAAQLVAESTLSIM